MGLYLCVFASPGNDEELDGVEVGSYDDFDKLRTTVARHLESGAWASRFPVLMSHRDSDGEWSPQEARELATELAVIEAEFAALPPVGFENGSWQAKVTTDTGDVPTTLADSFIDVDGEPLLARLRELTILAGSQTCPITFQ